MFKNLCNLATRASGIDQHDTSKLAAVATTIYVYSKYIHYPSRDPREG